jgi:hypothetical protein
MSDTKPNEVIGTAARLGLNDPRAEFIEYLVANRRWHDALEELEDYRRALEATPEFKLGAVLDRFTAEWESADDHEKLRLLQDWAEAEREYAQSPDRELEDDPELEEFLRPFGPEEPDR